MISVEGAIIAAAALGVLVLFQLWDDHRDRKHREEEAGRSAPPRAE